MIGYGGFGDYFCHFNDAARKNIYRVISLDSGCLWNDAAVYGGSMDLKFVVRDFTYQWKYLDSEYSMMFSVLLICCDYMDT